MYAKINSKWVTVLQVKNEIINMLKENIGELFYNLEFGKGILKIIKKFNYQKKLYSKTHYKQSQRKMTNLEKIHVILIIQG